MTPSPNIFFKWKLFGRVEGGAGGGVVGEGRMGEGRVYDIVYFALFGK